MEAKTQSVFGHIFHTEMRSTDPAATAAFLDAVFGWKVTDTPHPSFKMFDTPNGFEGHVGPVPEEAAGASATNYITVTDLEAAMTAVQAGGAQMLGEQKEIPNQGRFAWFEVPGGIPMVLWQHLES